MQLECWDLGLKLIHFEKRQSVEHEGAEGSSQLMTGLAIRLPQQGEALRAAGHPAAGHN